MFKDWLHNSVFKRSEDLVHKNYKNIAWNFMKSYILFQFYNCKTLSAVISVKFIDIASQQ